MSKSLRVAAVAVGLGLAAAVAGQGASAQSAARIHLLHGIPNTPVDVEVGGKNVFTNFAFGKTQDLSALAGQTLTGLKVKAAGTTTVAIDAGDVKLPASGNYTVVAHLDATGKPALAVFQNDTARLAAGKGRLVVRHAAAAPAVDIKANGAVAFAAVVNGKEGKADLASGTVKAEVVPAGAASPVVIGPADLKVTDGESLTVYAVGSLDAKTLAVLTETIAGLGTAPARVNTGNSPIDDGSSSGGLLAILLVVAGVGVGTGGLVAIRARRAA